MEAIAPFLPLLGIAFVFWLLIIRPQSRRNRELISMQQSIAVGDEVMLTSGIQGTVRGLGDDTFELEVSPGVVLRVARGAVGRIVARDDEPAGPTDPAGPEEL